MMYDSVSEQEPRWPQPEQKQVLQVVEESCQQLAAWPQKKRAGRPAKVSWSHLCLGILLCFVRGWNAQLEVWRLIGSERLGGFAPVKVCDQAIYNRTPQAGTSLQWVFEQVSAWLRTRQQWEDHRLAPWASSVYAADASTLDQMSRFLPWLREVAEGDKGGLGGQISALFDLRRQQWVRVDFWQDAKDNCKDHFLTLVEQVQAGALLLFDRGYLSFALFDALSARGIWWISRYANRVSYRLSFICYQGDGVLDAVVYLGTHRADQAKYAVRLIQFWLHGKQYR
jgi:hypothetical protein